MVLCAGGLAAFGDCLPVAVYAVFLNLDGSDFREAQIVEEGN